MTRANVLGIDIGGANIKYASTDGRAAASCFEMWKRPTELSATLVREVHALVPFDAGLFDAGTFDAGLFDAWAVTMTGELADCFIDRAEGVRSIVDSVVSAASQVNAPEPMFYGVDGQFRSATHAKANVDTIAAANWHALASEVAASIAGDGVLVDIGSTTCDLIPIADGRVATTATTDYERLLEQSLVYVGCRRTPVCGLVHSLNHAGRDCDVMNEWFATIDDARLVLGHVEESPDDNASADGGPRTADRAANRLARMIGLDRRDVSMDQAQHLAAQVMDAATHRIAEAFTTIEAKSPPGPIVLSGEGAALLMNHHGREVIRLADELGPKLSQSAPAWATARRWLAS